MIISKIHRLIDTAIEAYEEMRACFRTAHRANEAVIENQKLQASNAKIHGALLTAVTEVEKTKLEFEKEHLRKFREGAFG